MSIILKEGYDERTFFDERELIEYVNDTHTVSCSLYDDCEYPEKPPWQLKIDYSAEEWLDALGNSYINFVKPQGIGLAKYPPPKVDEMVKFFAYRKGELMAHILLDSFSVIEAGDRARKYDREIKRSPLQDALLKLVREGKIDLKTTLSPREFETLVAHTLRSIGFEKVVLKRYSKDGGIDVYAIIAEGDTTESVVVEVKHQKKPCGIKVMDRLNGVRDRENAERALLVCSGTITRDAFAAYDAMATQISGYAYGELLALLDDVGDWTTTAGGLWTKKIKCDNQ